MRLIQITTTYVSRDGIGGIMKGIHDAALARGLDSRLVTRYPGSEPAVFDPDLVFLSKMAEEAQEIKTCFVYHYGILDDRIDSFFEKNRSLKKVFYYHNVTPGHFFKGWEPGLDHVLDVTRSQSLPRLLDSEWIVTGDSHFNLSELPRNSRLRFASPVLPPVPEISIAKDMNKEVKPHLLFVGRFVPNKRQELLLYLAKALKDSGVPVRMTLVGKGGGSYFRAVRVLLKLMGLTETVKIVENADEETLKALYLEHPFFVAATEHEGFCIPVLEALAFGNLPLVRPYGALPELLGGSRSVAKGAREHEFFELVFGAIRSLARPEAYSVAAAESRGVAIKNLAQHQKVEDFLDRVILNETFSEYLGRDKGGVLSASWDPGRIRISMRGRIAYALFRLYRLLLTRQKTRRIIQSIEGRAIRWIKREKPQLNPQK